MTDSNSRLRQVESASAISRGLEKKPVEHSPETQRQADEITDKILSRLRESVRTAALFALTQQKNDSTAKIWLERRIFRPTQQLCERAIQVKKPSIPPPSARSPRAEADSTGTWKKAASSAPAARASVPPPSSSRQNDDEEASSALRRVLARPDRASVPPSKRPTPPPPGNQPRVAQDPAELLQTLPLERVARAPSSDAPVPPSGSAAGRSVAPRAATTPAGSRPSGELIPRLDQRLSTLAYLDSAIEQALFLLDLIQELAPAHAILLHTIESRSQEATIVGVHSPHASVLSGFVTQPQDPLVTQVRRLRRPVKVLSPGGDERVGKGRWAFGPPEKYLVALPVVHDHKLLGLIELADPLAGQRLTQEQLEALSDLADAWGSRLAQS